MSQSRSQKTLVRFNGHEYEPKALTPLELWLKQIGMSLPDLSHASLLDDPLRNGVYVCDLV